MDWIERAWLWFTRAAQFWLVQTLLMYLGACAVAGKPLGPKDYVRFAYHVIQWPANRVTTPIPAARLSDNQNQPHMNFLENR